MKTQIRLIDEARKERARALITRADENQVVEIKAYQENRSISQNSLYWLWCTVIGNELGESKAEVHFRNKKQHLLPILERVDDDFAQTMESLREVYRQGMTAQAEFLFKRVVEMASTSQLKVPHFTEYLKDIEREYLNLNIYLPHPEDYAIAMGAKDGRS